MDNDIRYPRRVKMIIITTYSHDFSPRIPYHRFQEGTTGLPGQEISHLPLTCFDPYSMIWTDPPPH